MDCDCVAMTGRSEGESRKVLYFQLRTLSGCWYHNEGGCPSLPGLPKQKPTGWVA